MKNQERRGAEVSNYCEISGDDLLSHSVTHRDRKSLVHEFLIHVFAVHKHVGEVAIVLVGAVGANEDVQAPKQFFFKKFFGLTAFGAFNLRSTGARATGAPPPARGMNLFIGRG